MVKRIISAILIFSALLGLCACSSPEPAETTGETTVELTTAPPETTAETSTAETSTETTSETPTAETTTETTPAETTTAQTTEAAPTETTAAETTATETTTAETTSAPAETEVSETSPITLSQNPYINSWALSKPYYIKVNNQQNNVTVYKKDPSGAYTVPFKAMVCSTGYATPQNQIFTLYGNGQWSSLPLLGNVYGRYATQIEGDFLFHSVPYTRYNDKSSIKYEEYDKLGTTCSMGCIRLPLEDAIWIYVHMSQIAAVEFYADEDPGPLGKPEAQKISDNELCRGWDPTDTDPANPWLTGVEPEYVESTALTWNVNGY